MLHTQTDITGCRFSLYPMSDDYVSIILEALRKTDTTKVWQRTDAMSTLYFGRQSNVISCVCAVFSNARKDGIHMAGEFMFSDASQFAEEVPDAILLAGDETLSSSSAPFTDYPAYAKVSLCTDGSQNREKHIGEIVRHAKQLGLQPGIVPYAIMLKGSATTLFAYFSDVIDYARVHMPSYALQATVSVNSPTRDDPD